MGLILALALPGIADQACALETDRDQPVEISADRAELDEKNFSARYVGHVELKQGSLQIKADSLSIQATADGKVEVVTATGEPAELSQQPDADTAPITAKARTIDYRVADDIVTLTGDAEARQENNLFRGEVIQYDMQKKVLQASGRDANDATGSTQGRVRMILYPRPRNERPTGTEPNIKATPQ
jgi:lipopolysaccharide export system protein LptA